MSESELAALSAIKTGEQMDGLDIAFATNIPVAEVYEVLSNLEKSKLIVRKFRGVQAYYELI